jgi:predicted transcriptional regulator
MNMKNTYYPKFERATDEFKEKLIREININNPHDLPEKVEERPLTMEQIKKHIPTNWK